MQHKSEAPQEFISLTDFGISLEVDLLLAAGRGDAERVKAILAKKIVKVDCKIPTRDGKGKEKFPVTPLIYATRNRQIGTMTVLLDNKANCNVTLDGCDPLMIAAESGDIGVFRLIMLYRISVNNNGYKDIDATAWPFRRTALMLAVIKGHNEIVKEILKLRPNDLLKDSEEQAAIHFAVANNNVDTIKILADNNKQCLNYTGYNRRTPLSMAALNGCIDAVEYLLNAGVNVLAKDKDEKTALDLAKSNGHLEIMSLMSSYVEKVKHKNTSLLKAASAGDEAAVVKLIEEGAEVDSFSLPAKEVSPAPVTPLMAAANNAHVGVMQILLDRGASSDIMTERKSNPLVFAVDSGVTEAARLLLKHQRAKLKEYVNHQNKFGYTALHTAVERGRDNVEMLDLLLRNEALLEMEENDGNTALSQASRKNNLNCITYLLESRANIEHRNHNGNTPLMIAVYNDHVPAVQLLIKSGASIHVKSASGLTPLMAAVINGYTELVALLLQCKGIWLNDIDNDSETALLKAINRSTKESMIDIIKLLLAAKPDLTLFYRSGYTALHLAIQSGNSDLVSLLVNAGASITQTPLATNQTPVDIAKEAGYINIANYLSSLLEPKNISNDTIQSPLQRHSLLTGDVPKEEAPEQYYCPLTLELIEIPATFIRTGISYERAAAMKWIIDNQCGPLREKLVTQDGKPITVEITQDNIDLVLTRNIGLQQLIEEYRNRNKLPVKRH